MKKQRLHYLIAGGAALALLSLGARLVATGALARWRAARASDAALAREAARPGARYPLVFEWATRLERAGRLPEAASAYHRAAEMNPVASEAWIGWGRSAYAAGDWRGASRIMAKTVSQWPAIAGARFVYAAVLASTFRLQAAAEQLRQGLRIEPDHSGAWQTLGDLNLKLDDPAGAVAAYQEAYRLDPNAAGLGGALGAALMRAGRGPDAVPLLENALKLNPADLEARYYLGTALAGTGREPDRVRALMELNRVIQFGSPRLAALGNLAAAHVWLRDGNRSDAIQALEHAIDKDPANIEALRLLIDLYRQDGRVAQARRFQPALERLQTRQAERDRARAAIESSRDLAGDLVRYGKACQALGDADEARAAFEAALREQPGRAAAVDAIKALARPPGARSRPPASRP